MASAPLISVSEIKKQLGLKTLFQGISFTIGEKERVGLIGPNGSGKSTLLKILARTEDPDSGMVRSRNDLSLSYVAQEDRFDEALTVGEVVTQALSSSHRYTDRDVAARLSSTLGKAGFHDRSVPVSSLSGGWKKRLSLARALATDPDVLLLDEPTNHLDIDGIFWLEELLERSSCSSLFVSHDRYFIENLADRVIEINPVYPNGYFTSEGGYSDFLENRANYLEGLRQTQASLANKVRREVAWLRQGAKARSTKCKHRTAEAGKMMEELQGMKFDEKRVNIDFSASGRRSKELLKTEGVTKKMGERTLIRNISLTLTPGTRLGVVGSNGSGKTTFLKLLTGDLAPDEGRVIRAPNLRIAYFDQARKQIDPTATIKSTLAPDSDSVVFQGRSIHIASWVTRFLLSSNQLSLPIQSLSGGEQARVLLAKLMLEEADMLIFDEPTNDLDIATLEILEESFLEYPGAIVLVTHDRYFLDKVVNTVFGLNASGGNLYGEYQQWELDRRNKTEKEDSSNRSPAIANKSLGKPRTKLTYNEQKELSTMESRILKAEENLQRIQEHISSEEISSNTQLLADGCEELSNQQLAIDELYARWEELEEKSKA